MNATAELPAGAGLCGRCRHARAVETRRASRFVLCDLSRTDPRYPRYPSLPVLRCDGFDEAGRPSPPDRAPD